MIASSVPRVVEVSVVRGARAAVDAPPAWLIEVPHGATATYHFTSLRSELRGPFPDNLIDFFYVNTDVGAPECARALAERLVARAPEHSAAVLVCQIPRTFIDCNRVIDDTSAPTTSQAGGMTPGVVRYVKEPADLSLLMTRYRAYRDAVSAAVDVVCGAGGTAVMLHSYAPRSVDVPVDEDIVARLHDAYRPEVEPTWPLRPAVDLITKTPDGQVLADARLVARARAAFTAAGLEPGDSVSYPLHPASLAHTFAARFPGRTLCLEVRRDLLVQHFTPFAEMQADRDKVGRVATALADALLG